MVAVVRAESLAAVPVVRAFDVYPGVASDQAQVLAAASALDAAMRFLEGWHPNIADGGPVDLSVVDRASGETIRFDLELD